LGDKYIDPTTDYTGEHTECICNQNGWFPFISMCWIQIWP